MQPVGANRTVRRRADHRTSKRHIVGRLRCGIAAVLLALPAVPTAAQSDVSCSDCHTAEAGELLQSVHRADQVSCADCHGGSATYRATAEQRQAGAFDHGAGFTGKPSRFEVPEKCARCHSDVEKMNPYGLPADQLARYRTSAHGKAIFNKHDANAAVCTDCHGVHTIQRSSDPRSWTHPRNVPATCGRCHGDAALMADYGHSPEIVTEYLGSVHGQGLLQDHDTGMPTCATCHGNHAAAPPGVSSVNAVCARCHRAADQFFAKSPHARLPMFQRCIACHGGTHGHDIQRLTLRPSQLSDRFGGLAPGLADDAMVRALHPGLSALQEACAECHDEDSDDEADVTALQRSAALYRLIGEAELEFARTAKAVERTGQGVLLVEEEQMMMAQAQTAVVEVGPAQHTLDPGEVGALVDQLRETTAAVRESLARKESKLRWRYQVLGPMWGFIMVFAVASYIKYRRLRAQQVIERKP